MSTQEVYFKDMEDEELIRMVKGLYSAIYINDCFGVSDLLNLSGAQQELEKRGYVLTETSELAVRKLCKNCEGEFDLDEIDSNGLCFDCANEEQE